ncbi:hypothetical protein PAE9249_04973 [Paenibacillus sp. CECT 9249]|uniref:XkdQ/YqbQ family protein n=1 Tax=Paenibacillus sp. CECT 9249 TaxID=2845385 RepID=UPI001E3700D7|nr:hypothetical protein [Paenibacillus sp. CECT 9249]CAH0122423.1 hypothetical protein PAE9249_04973 [Paenibacillus sp. CECT 9249]
MLQILMDSRDGTIWDVSDIVSDVTWKTSRRGKASSLDFTMLKDERFKCGNGDVVKVRLGERDVFYGYVFSIDSGKDENIKITAYDQIRYLMANDTYVFENVTAAQVVAKIAADFGLRAGAMADTKHRLSMIEDNKKLIDIICKALDYTLFATGEMYVLLDDFGQLTVRNVKEMTVDFFVGDRSLMTDYTQKRSIDNDTYNRVKIVQNNKKTGRREVHIEQHSGNIARWGLLQLYKTADEEKNAAQIREELASLMKLKNREQRTLSVEALGDIRVRAGCFVPIAIEELGLNQYFLVDECTHKNIGDAAHTMSLELKVI